MMRILIAVLLVVGARAGELDVLPPGMQPAPSQAIEKVFVEAARGQLERRRKDIAEIRTKDQFEQRRAEMRKRFLGMLGGLPAERSPLNVRVTGTLERDGYRVEKIVYESQPKLYVTAALYVPTTGKGPYPAVLQSIGHSPSAKARRFYQTLPIGLVKSGFVVLSYDPAGQGERKMFFDADLGDSKAGGPTAEHERVGMRALLTGESLARYMIWDGIRGIDLLASRPEVDAKRIGAAGCSGGGTLTTYIAALDDRVAVATPACYISSWEEQFATTGPQDAEQQFPGMLAAGFDHADFVEMVAPKPYLICSTTEDFFPLEGARRTYEEAKRIYGLFGAGDRIQWFSTGGPHDTPKPTREAIYSWFNRWLRGAAGPVAEPPIDADTEESLLCTPTGQISTSLGGETASTLVRTRAAAMLSPKNPGEAAVRNRTGFKPATDPVSAESHGVLAREGYRIERLAYWKYIPALLFTPDKPAPGRPAILFVDTRGKAQEARPGGDLDALAKLGYTVLAIDPIGTGETAFKDIERIAWMGLMIGKPLMGYRMQDVIRGIDILEQRNLLANGLIGFGKGRLAVDLLHAAAVDRRLSALVLENMPASYRAIASAPLHKEIHDIVLNDVLRAYDLPDLVRSLAPRPVTLINLRNPTEELLRLAAARQEYADAGNVTVRVRREAEPVQTLFFAPSASRR
jgi:dienelactone hydrolase